jgi:hypothetical protein
LSERSDRLSACQPGLTFQSRARLGLAEPTVREGGLKPLGSSRMGKSSIGRGGRESDENKKRTISPVSG